MGDIIVPIRMRSSSSVRARMLNCYFDTGSPHTFISQDVAALLGGILTTTKLRKFRGLGGGSFQPSGLIEIEFRLVGFWCRNPVYVVPREVITDDLLVGHDFMQRYGVKLDPKKHSIKIDESSVRHAQRIRRIVCGHDMHEPGIQEVD